MNLSLSRRTVRNASRSVLKDGEVVLRLRDSKVTIRVKLGASENGSRLVLIDDQTKAGILALAEKDGTTLTLISKHGKK